MPTELYRTYEVLIEETVSPDHPKRAKTKKDDTYKAEVHGALCTTNELYQDAVCYYTILLAGLAGDVEERPGVPLNPLWREIASAGGKFKSQADQVVQKLAGKFKPLNGCKTAEDLRNTALEKPADSANIEKLFALQRQIYAQLQGDGTKELEGVPTKCNDMATFASNYTRYLCNPASTQTDRTQDQRNKNYFAALAAELKATQKRDEHLAEHVELKWCFLTPEGQELSGQEALLDYVAAFFGPAASRKVKRPGAYPDSLKLQADRLLKEWGDKPRRAKGEKAGEFKKRKQVWEDKAKQFPLKSYKARKPNQLLWYCLRYKWCQDEASRLSLLDRLKDFKSVAVSDQATDAVTAWKALVTNRRVFKFFTSLFSGDANTIWLEFDDAAFSTAAEDVFKYKIRALQRQAKVERLRAVKRAALEQNGFETFARENSPTGKQITVRGMKSDPRRAKMEKLLKEMSEDKGLNAYGLETGTIGGWADVRDRFLALEAKGQTDEANLVAAVDESQTENRQGFGSADFFHALCKPEYHEIWSSAGASTDAAKANGISDFVVYYTRYSEWIEDLTELEPEEGIIKPISYTFPGMPNRHGDVSLRHFNFKAPLNTQFEFPKLFTSENTAFKLLSGAEAVKVTLSARRLKRDRIVNAQGDSLGALWCPPLVVAEGDSRPRAGKLEDDGQQIKDISFSLMVAAATDEKTKPPVHLKVQVPVTSDETAKLEAETSFWRSGSLRGYAKKGDADADKRKHWVWPRDLETAKKDEEQRALQEKVKAAELWCGDGTRGTFRLGFWKRSAEGKWSLEDSLTPDFHVLSVDLGNRFCAAFARLRVHTDGMDEEKRGRLLSPDHNWATPVYGQLVNKGTLRLQGEDAKIWQLGESAPTNEPYGNDGRGRFPSEERREKAAFLKLAEDIIPQFSAPIRAVDQMTYPEMGDHLVWRSRRRLSRIRALFKLRWLVHPNAEKWNPKTGRYDLKFSKEERDDNRRKAVEMLAKMYSRPKREEDEQEDAVYSSLRLALASEDEWSAKFASLENGTKKSPKNKDAIREAVRQWRIGEDRWVCFLNELKNQLEMHLDGDQKQLATRAMLESVVEWCLPLRKRHWHWMPDKDKPLLSQGKHGPKDGDCEAPTHIPFVQGMRGLSLRRLDQVLSIRQLCQSYARAERRWMQSDTGINDLVVKRGEDLHDPCPDLLAKSNELREQRVYQTAHLILTEALGLELKNPGEVERDGKTKKELKSEVDLHGAYQPKMGKDGKPLPRCSVIVLEDLTRYRTSQERTRAENSRLMKWAHRAIVNKLADMAKPFGITIMLVDPAFSSRFHSRTGIAGIRVSEVSRGFEKEMPFAAWRARVKQSGEKDDLAEQIEKLVAHFDAHKSYKETLLLAIEGGKLFLPAAVHGERKASEPSAEGLLNADENAAVNIGLRALAHPDRMDIFPRLRTRLADGVAQVRNKRGWFATFPEGDPRRELHKNPSEIERRRQAASKKTVNGEEDSGESSDFPDFFVVIPEATEFAGLPAGDAYHLCGEAAQNLPKAKAYQRKLFWPRVQQVCLERVKAINLARLVAGK